MSTWAACKISGLTTCNDGPSCMHSQKPRQTKRRAAWSIASKCLDSLKMDCTRCTHHFQVHESDIALFAMCNQSIKSCPALPTFLQASSWAISTANQPNRVTMFELPAAVDQSTFRVMLSGELGGRKSAICPEVKSISWELEKISSYCSPYDPKA